MSIPSPPNIPPSNQATNPPQYALDLFAAAKKGDLDRIKKIIADNSKNPDFRLTYVDENLDSLLHIATRNQDLEMVNFILALNKYLVNYENLAGRTPIFYAKDNKIVHSLIKASADIFVEDNYGNSVLNYWLKSDWGPDHLHELSDNVHLLCEKIISYNSLSTLDRPDLLKQTPLVSLCYNASLYPSVDSHVSNKSDASSIKSSQSLPKTSKDVASLVKLFIDNNAFVNNPNSPLLASSSFGDIKSVKLLLNNGADVHQVSEDGMTALTLAFIYAIGDSQVELIRTLTKAGANIEEITSEHVLSLFKQLTPHNIQFIERLIVQFPTLAPIFKKAIVENNELGQKAVPLFKIARSSNSKVIMELFSQAKTNPNFSGKGMSALTKAVQEGNLQELEQLLVLPNIDILARDGLGNSAVSLIEQKTYPYESIRSLIRKKELEIKNASEKEIKAYLDRILKESNLARDLKVLFSYNKESQHWLSEKIKECNQNKIPIFLNACLSGDLLFAKILHDLGANPNLCDLEGRTALHHAISLEDKILFKFLLDCPHLNPSLVDNMGDTPIMDARRLFLKNFVTALEAKEKELKEMKKQQEEKRQYGPIDPKAKEDTQHKKDQKSEKDSEDQKLLEEQTQLEEIKARLIHLVTQTGHVMGLSGSIEIPIPERKSILVPTEGSYAHESCLLLEKLLSRFCKQLGKSDSVSKQHFDFILRALNLSEHYLSANGSVSAKSLYDAYKNDQIAILYTGWRTIPMHDFTITFYKDFLIICDRGDSPITYDTQIYLIKNSQKNQINEELFSELLLYPDNSKEHIYNTLANHGFNFNDERGYYLPNKAQAHRTCTFVNGKSAIHGILFALRVEETNDPDEALYYAGKAYKAFTVEMRNNFLVQELLLPLKNVKTEQERDVYLKILAEILIQHHGQAKSNNEDRLEKRKQEIERAILIFENLNPSDLEKLINILKKNASYLSIAANLKLPNLNPAISLPIVKALKDVVLELEHEIKNKEKKQQQSKEKELEHDQQQQVQQLQQPQQSQQSPLPQEKTKDKSEVQGPLGNQDQSKRQAVHKKDSTALLLQQYKQNKDDTKSKGDEKSESDLKKKEHQPPPPPS